MKHFLVGLDGSERAGAVLQAASGFATSEGARLIVVRAVGLSPDLPPEAYQSSPDEVVALALRFARAFVERQVSKIAPPNLERIDIRLGVPWQVLCDMAKTEKSDLLIVGTHGYGGFDRLLGTTATRVVNHAPCSVLVVRSPRPVESDASAL